MVRRVHRITSDKIGTRRTSDEHGHEKTQSTENECDGRAGFRTVKKFACRTVLTNAANVLESRAQYEIKPNRRIIRPTVVFVFVSHNKTAIEQTAGRSRIRAV